MGAYLIDNATYSCIRMPWIIAGEVQLRDEGLHRYWKHKPIVGRNRMALGVLAEYGVLSLETRFGKLFPIHPHFVSCFSPNPLEEEKGGSW